MAPDRELRKFYQEWSYCEADAWASRTCWELQNVSGREMKQVVVRKDFFVSISGQVISVSLQHLMVTFFQIINKYLILHF